MKCSSALRCEEQISQYPDWRTKQSDIGEPPSHHSQSYSHSISTNWMFTIDKIEGRGLIYFNEMFVVSELKIQHSWLSNVYLAGQCQCPMSIVYYLHSSA